MVNIADHGQHCWPWSVIHVDHGQQRYDRGQGCVCRSQFDTDDEVRDRATFYLNVLNEQQKALNLTYIINGRSFY